MTALRQIEAPTGLLPGDHVCGIVADAAGFSAAVLPFLDEGLIDELHDDALVTCTCLYGAALGTSVPGPPVLLHPVHHGADAEEAISA